MGLAALLVVLNYMPSNFTTSRFMPNGHDAGVKKILLFKCTILFIFLCSTPRSAVFRSLFTGTTILKFQSAFLSHNAKLEMNFKPF